MSNLFEYLSTSNNPFVECTQKSQQKFANIFFLPIIFRSAVQSTKENNSSDNFVLSSFPSKYHPQKHTQAFLTPFSIFAVILIEFDDAHKV